VTQLAAESTVRRTGRKARASSAASGLPLLRGEWYFWAPGRGIRERAAFPAILHLDSPGMRAAVDFTAIVASLAPEDDPGEPKTPSCVRSGEGPQRQTQLDRELAEAKLASSTLRNRAGHSPTARPAMPFPRQIHGSTSGSSRFGCYGSCLVRRRRPMLLVHLVMER